MTNSDYQNFAVRIPAKGGSPATFPFPAMLGLRAVPSFPASWDYPTTWHPAIHAHCLLVGGADEERTTLIHSIVDDFTAAEWSVQQSDSIEKQREMIADIWVLMEQRYSQWASDPSARDEWDPILLVVDEAYCGISRTPTVKSQVQELLALARSAKIHILVGASSPPVELLSGAMRDNLAVRIPLDRETHDHQLMQRDAYRR